MLSVKQVKRSVIGDDPVRPDELRAHISTTYFNLRRGTVVVSFLLPLLLPVALYLAGKSGLLPSISHYYTNGTDFTRNWFIGSLCVVGVFLYLYKGYSNTENIVLNVAGLLVVVVALVPCRCGDLEQETTVHGFAAVTFFLCIAFVCIRCSRDTLSLISEEKTRNKFKKLYRLIGMAMIGLPAIAVLISVVFQRFDYVRFWVEGLGIWTFATYWWVKGRELSLTEAETLVLQGKAEKQRGRGLVKIEHPATAGLGANSKSMSPSPPDAGAGARSLPPP